ncbi:hypothetical protein AJ80_03469 [Polytolypa hystricis UAMH7299]|uniref:CBM1 domain-containing protein n=1 Tax=Polytolypa hystricis (strain UAMH7299) TaxID=1447883 RepID=A0A2B7YHZ1_POLH7|nr:hypothetical protein AJ80_03469 [Polytolypa hystricis UAMH7299]
MAITSVLSLCTILLAGAAQVSAQQTVWGQCGGNDWSGPTDCESGSYCSELNEWYAQCVPGTGMCPFPRFLISTMRSPDYCLIRQLVDDMRFIDPTPPPITTTTPPPPVTTTTPDDPVTTTTPSDPETTPSQPTGGPSDGEGFENGWDQSAWPTYAPSCNQGGTVALDSSKAHSGSNSIKVTGGSSGYCGHIFFGTTQVPSGNVYVRTYLMTQTALDANHISFITMPDSGVKSLRIGGQNGILMFNRESDDATLPDLSPQGVASSKSLVANNWHCFEYLLGTDGSIQTWLDGTVVDGLTVGGGASNPNSNGWGTSYTPNISGVYFGWESYSGGVNTMWYDDIVIGSSRTGC